MGSSFRPRRIGSPSMSILTLDIEGTYMFNELMTHHTRKSDQITTETDMA
jgi:hypothetical protein